MGDYLKFHFLQGAIYAYKPTSSGSLKALTCNANPMPGNSPSFNIDPTTPVDTPHPLAVDLESPAAQRASVVRLPAEPLVPSHRSLGS